MFLKVKKELLDAAIGLISNVIPCGNQQAVNILNAFKDKNLCSHIEESEKTLTENVEQATESEDK